MTHSPATTPKTIENKSGIRPMQFKLVIEVERAEERTKGGIFVPENAQDRRQFEITRGLVVAVGPAAFTDHNQYPEGTERPKVGDRIWFDKHAGTQVKAKRDHSLLYRIIEDTDVTGIVDEAEIMEGVVA
jgi:chaperonin GroES